MPTARMPNMKDAQPSDFQSCFLLSLPAALVTEIGAEPGRVSDKIINMRLACEKNHGSCFRAFDLVHHSEYIERVVGQFNSHARF
jgi:hypothetical protein